MTSMNNEIDYCYKLYKIIFKNKLLVNKIYKIVRGINRQKTNSDIKNKSFKRRCKYSEANLNWCIKNNHYQLLFDKVKIGTIFNIEDLTFYNLYKLFKIIKQQQQQQQQDEIINQFFKSNGDNLLGLKFGNKKTNFVSIDILSFSIYTGSYKFVKLVYNSLQRKTNSLIEIINSSNVSPNGNLLELSLKIGNLDIIEMMNKQLNIGFNFDIKNLDRLLSYTLTSENRDQVLEYLLKNNSIDTCIENNNNNKTGFYLFSDKLKLKFIIFKQLYEKFDCIRKFDKNQHETFSNNIANEIIKNNDENDNQDVDIVLNFLQISCYMFSKQQQSDLESTTSIINSIKLLKKINHLLEFNKSKDESLIELYKKEKEEEENKSKKENKSNGGGFKLSKLFNKSKKKNGKNNNNNNNNNQMKSNEIKYIDFNLKREIYRLFIFDYLKSIIKYSNLSIDIINLLVCYFSSKFNEYHLITNELLDNELDGRTFKLCTSLISISFKNLDSKLIDLIPKLSSSLKPHLNLKSSNIDSSNLNTDTSDSKISFKLPHSSRSNCDKQIEFIGSFFKLDFQLIFKSKFEKLLNETVLLKSFFKINSGIERCISIQQLDEIAKILIETNKSRLIYPTIFIYNINVFKYYYENHKQLFNWDSDLIGKLVISSGNLELIQFIHENKIGSLDLHYSIYHSKTRQVAQFMHDTLGCYKFGSYQVGGNLNLPSIKLFSKLDDWKSNYLFIYSINKSIDICNNGIYNITINSVGNSYKTNFNHWKFLKSSKLLMDTNNNILLKKQKVLSVINNPSNLFNNINFVILDTCNLNFIKRFLKSLTNDNLLNFTLKLSSQTKDNLKRYHQSVYIDFIKTNNFIKK